MAVLPQNTNSNLVVQTFPSSRTTILSLHIATLIFLKQRLCWAVFYSALPTVDSQPHPLLPFPYSTLPPYRLQWYSNPHQLLSVSLIQHKTHPRCATHPLKIVDSQTKQRKIIVKRNHSYSKPFYIHRHYPPPSLDPTLKPSFPTTTIPQLPCSKATLNGLSHTTTPTFYSLQPI